MRAGVVGGGTMGVGIAHGLVVSGAETIVVEPVPSQSDKARRAIEDVLAKGVQRGRLSSEEASQAKELLSFVDAVDRLPGQLDIVIESVPENPEVKRGVLREIERRHPAVVGSNTSSIAIGALARALERPDTFLGTHFFNPVWSMKLVELVIGTKTARSTVDTVRGVMTAMGKEVIEVSDVPGFATSRLGVLLGLEAIRMVESGVASAADIDKAMTLGYGHPMGPLRLTDLVGLDVRLSVARYLRDELGDRFRPPDLLEQMVAEGRLGQKAGRGFYDWSS
jgi:3-hydroxybutyryl-CoA dehydrogenase